VRPESELEELLLVEAYKRRQRIEILKTKAILMAMVNPDKAHEAFMEYLKLASPDYAGIRKDMDDKLINVLHGGMENVFVLGKRGGAFIATEVKREDA